MKILISAYACEPGRGSEPGVGWNLVRELSKHHELVVLTRRNNRSVIEQSEEAWTQKVDWQWVDPPYWLTFWKRGGRGLQLFYILWQREAFRRAKELVRLGKEFDVVHHLTFGKYWIPSPLARLDCPFIFGPVGGGEATPPGLSRGYSLRGRISEWARGVIQRAVSLWPPLRELYQSADWTFAATEQTASRLRSLGVTKLSILPQSGIGDDELSALDQERTPLRKAERLELVTACRLIHWKAVDLAIEAVGRLIDQGLSVHLTVLQDGPEKEGLEELVRKRKLTGEITFTGRLASLNEVYAKIGQANLLLHPALHEAFGQSCLEALAIGTPVVCLDWGGPGMIVDDASGWAISPGSREETIEGIATAVGKYASLDLAGREALSKRCKQRAADLFHWENLTDVVLGQYEKLKHRSSDNK